MCEVGGGGGRGRGRGWWKREGEGEGVVEKEGGDTVQRQYYQLMNGQYLTLPLISSDVELSI